MTGPTTRTMTLTLVGFLSTACGTPAETLDEVRHNQCPDLQCRGIARRYSSSNPTDSSQISPLNAYDQSCSKTSPSLTRAERPSIISKNPKDRGPDADGLNRFSHCIRTSRTPTMERVTVALTAECQRSWDCMAEKGSQWREPHWLRESSLIFITTMRKLEAEKPTWLLEPRDLLSSPIHQLHSAGHAVIVGGDTNLHRFDPADDPVLSAFESDNNLTDACGFLGCGTESIDRFFFRQRHRQLHAFKLALCSRVCQRHRKRPI